MSVDVELMEEQTRFMQSDKPIVAYIGGIGSGKTYIACIKAVKNALVGRNQLMVGLTFPHARDVIYATLKRVLMLYGLKEGCHWSCNKTNLEFILFGKTMIFVKSAELGDKLRGYTVSDIFIDEASYADIELFNILLGRMREVEDGQIHLTTSPLGFNWVFDLTNSSDCEYIKVSTFKNPFLPKRYIRNMLKQYSSTFIRQELYGDFINLSTGVFKSTWIKPLSHNIELHKRFTTEKHETVRFYDFAFTEDGDYTAGIKVTKIGGDYIISDIVRVRMIYPNLRPFIFKTAQEDGTDVIIGLERAGQQIAVINDLVRSNELSNFIKKDFSVAKYGHKMKRILVLASAAENNQIYITDDCKNKLHFFKECDELNMSDSHQHDDMVDAAASAYLMLNNKSNPITGIKSSIY